MTKDKLWEIYVSRNPKFLTEGAALTPSGLKKFFDQTWEAGHDQGVANGRVLGAEEERKKIPKDLFSGIFGIGS